LACQQTIFPTNEELSYLTENAVAEEDRGVSGLYELNRANGSEVVHASRYVPLDADRRVSQVAKARRAIGRLARPDSGSVRDTGGLIGSRH